MGFSGAGQPLAALLWACSRVGSRERLLCVSLGVGGLEDPGGGRSTIPAGPLVAPKRCWPGAPPQLTCHSLGLGASPARMPQPWPGPPPPARMPQPWPGAPPQLARRSLCFLTYERGTVSFTVKEGGEV